MKKLVLLLVVLLFIIPSSFAIGQSAKLNYTESGNFDNLYQLGLGAFNSALDPDTVNNEQTTSVIVSNGRKIPLVSDLDGDGFIEVIILDGRNIEIYQNKSLTFVTSFTLDTASNERFSNILTFDIDGDGLIEIILVAEEERELHILEYNRSNLVNQTRFQGTDLSGVLQNSGILAGEVEIKCSSVERCLMVHTNRIQSVPEPANVPIRVLATFFNSTENSIDAQLTTSLIEGGTNRDVYCLPNIRHISVADYDGDNGGATSPNDQKEFIASVMRVNIQSNDEEVNVFWIDILDNNSVVLEDNPGQTNPVTSTRPGDIIEFIGSGTAISCDGNAINKGGIQFPIFPGFYVSSPLVFDADFSESGLETIVGMGISSNDFKMIMFEKDGSFLDDFPETSNTEGIMMSNVFKADIFDDSTEDFCIMGFNGDPGFPTLGVDDSLSVTCGSLNDPDGFGNFNIQTLQFRFDKAGLFNISLTYDQQAVLSHSAEMNTANDIDEIISAYGVLELDRDDSIFSTCSGILGICDMDLVFAHRKTSNDPRVITTDAFDKFGLEDMIILTNLNLFYLDDGVTNQPINEFCGESGSIEGQCIEYIINPCLESIWQINTTIQIKIIPKDPESDLTSVRARTYAGTPDEQDSGFINVSSGQEATISVDANTGLNFNANKSGGGFNLILEAVDIIENPGTIRSITKQYSVAQIGVETFDCTTSVTSGLQGINVSIPILNISAEAISNEALTDFIEETSNLFKISPLIIILFLMLGWSIAVLTTKDRVNDSMVTMNKVLFLLIGNIIIFIIGSIIGAISFGILLVVVILAIFSIVLWARRQFTANQM